MAAHSPPLLVILRLAVLLPEFVTAHTVFTDALFLQQGSLWRRSCKFAVDERCAHEPCELALNLTTIDGYVTFQAMWDSRKWLIDGVARCGEEVEMAVRSCSSECTAFHIFGFLCPACVMLAVAFPVFAFLLHFLIKAAGSRVAELAGLQSLDWLIGKLHPLLEDTATSPPLAVQVVGTSTRSYYHFRPSLDTIAEDE